MKRVLSSFGTTILILSCGILGAWFTLPASWLTGLPGRESLFQVAAADGSMWNGQAIISVGPTGQRQSIIPAVRWSTHWRPIPVATVEHPWLSSPIQVQAGLTGISISASSLTLPVAILSALDAKIAALGPNGVITVQWPHIFTTWNRLDSFNVPLTLTWRNASLQLSAIAPLGTYKAVITQTSPGNYQLQVSTLAGPLFVQGNGALSHNEGHAFDGHAFVDPQAPSFIQTGLAALLSRLGPLKNGQTKLNLP